MYTESMILLIHILIAVAGMGVATSGLIKPAMGRIIASYGFIIATVGSGAVLLFTTGADVLKTCLTGLLYVTIASLITIAAHTRVRRLAAEGLKTH